jgi:hypothetical protein
MPVPVWGPVGDGLRRSRDCESGDTTTLRIIVFGTGTSSLLVMGGTEDLANRYSWQEARAPAEELELLCNDPRQMGRCRTASSSPEESWGSIVPSGRVKRAASPTPLVDLSS